MSNKDTLNILINHIVNSTLNVVMSDPITLLPVSVGSGCYIKYKNRFFFVSVQHVTDKTYSQIGIYTGIVKNNSTEIYVPPALNFIDEYEVTMDNPLGDLSKLGSYDIAFTEVPSDLLFLQKELRFGDSIVNLGVKSAIDTDLDVVPQADMQYSVYGRIGTILKNDDDNRKVLQVQDKLVLGMKYDRKIGLYERFILSEPIKDEAAYAGMSGAPIISEVGDPVAFLTHGFKNEKYLYGFSSIELAKALDKFMMYNSAETIIRYENRRTFLKSHETYVRDSKLNFESIVEGTGVIPSEENNPGYISYPIFYGTNRRYNTVDGALEFIDERAGDLRLGKCNISIPKFHKVGRVERPGWFSQLFGREIPEKHVMILQNEILETEKLISGINKQLESAGERDVLIFVHGFNVNFKEAMYRTAQLGYDLNFQGAVNAFAWPSQGKTAGYITDMDSARHSANFLKEYIELIINNTNPSKIHLIAHSMGNVVLTEALIKLKNEAKFPSSRFNQIILAAPDIDKDIFLKDILPAIKNQSGLTLYASDKDLALIASRKLRSGFVRIGDGGKNILVVDGVISIDASLVNTSLLGHGYFSDTQSLINDIHGVLADIPPDKRILDKHEKVTGSLKLPYWILRHT